MTFDLNSYLDIGGCMQSAAYLVAILAFLGVLWGLNWIVDDSNKYAFNLNFPIVTNECWHKWKSGNVVYITLYFFEFEKQFEMLLK